jgi:predicted ArsR family transcriptional regulator
MKFATTIEDLGKPQWIAMLKALKSMGEMTTADLARALDVSYMGAKQNASELTRLGYVKRVRVPRTGVGRPEISYRLAAKADALFPDMAMGFLMELLENSRMLFGENAPERMIYEHFETQRLEWTKALENLPGVIERAAKIAALRSRAGAWCRLEQPQDDNPRLVEIHTPLAPLFAKYPGTATMETRALEALLGRRIERRELDGGDSRPARVEFVFSAHPANVI